MALILAVPGLHHGDSAVHLLAALGISTLFLHAGLEVELTTLRRALGPLSVYLSMRVLSIAAVAWLAGRFLDLRWQDATLLALALLTSSTGFIIDSLVLATMLRTRGAISDEVFGGLLLYAGLNTLLPHSCCACPSTWRRRRSKPIARR